MANSTEMIEDIIAKVDELNTRARERDNDPSAEAQQLAEEALTLAEKELYKKGLAEALLTLVWRNYLRGNSTLMLEQSERVLAIALETGDKSMEAKACNTIGMAYQNFSEQSKALEYLMRSLAILEEAGKKRGAAIALGNIGLVYQNTALYSKALEHYMRSLAISEEIGDKNVTATALCNIGIVYRETSEFSKALEYLMRSLAISEETGNKRGAAIALGGIGNVYQNTSEYSNSLEYHMRALAINEEISNKDGVAACLVNIGNVYASISENGKAMEYYLRGLAINEEMGNKRGCTAALGNIGEIYARREFPGYDADKGLEYLTKALAVAEDIGAKDLIFGCHKAIAEVYKQLEDWKSFAEHLEKFYEVEKEVHNEESQKKIYNLEQQQKFAEIEKEREIERREQKATFKILNRVLPRQIVDRVKAGEENIADKFPSASVLFADIVGFTPLAEKLGADQVLKLLSSIFSHFDSLCEKYGVEKIKTVGDSYMAAAGVPVADEEHLLKIARLAIAMQEDIKLNLDFKIPELSIRIGIHTGEVIAGVLGTQKLSYDIWGDTVNTAARMESHGEPDMIHVTEEVFKALKDKFVFKERGEMEIKGKGMMKTYFLLKEIDITK